MSSCTKCSPLSFCVTLAVLLSPVTLINAALFPVPVCIKSTSLLLPIIAGFLLWIMNKASVLGKYKNSKLQNVIGFVILITTIFLGLKGILSVFKLI